MLKTPIPSRRARLLGGGLIVLTAIGGAVAAWSAQPPQKVLDPAKMEAQARAYAHQFLDAELAKTTDQAERQGLIEREAAVDTGPFTTRFESTPPQVSTGNSVIQPAPAPSAAPQPSLPDPNWAEVPTGADLAASYPDEALRQETGGKVAMRCVVTETGAVNNCTIIQETPLGFGFGDSALAMADKFKMNTVTKDGAPTAGATVIIPVRFALSQ